MGKESAAELTEGRTFTEIVEKSKKGSGEAALPILDWFGKATDSKGPEYALHQVF